MARKVVTEDSVRSLITKIECSLQEKLYSLVAFMYIQGAFDSTTFVAEQEAM